VIKIEVNHRQIDARPDETILSVLKRIGIKVPTLCHLEGMFPSGACRMCVVEVEGIQGLIPSCAQPVVEGMKIQTHSAKAIQARKTIIELLLANHPDDCLYCVRNGDCELQFLAEELGVRQRRYAGEKSSYKIDSSNPSIIRDPAKCILCGKCVRVCEEIQGVSAIDFIGRGSRSHVGPAFDEGLNVSSCVNCGQCIAVCPTGALREQSVLKQVMNALNDPEQFVVVQHAPAVSVSLGEAFGMKPGADVIGVMTRALKQLGFDRVFDTSFSADLTIMEEAAELVARIQNGGSFPMMTSCSPGWIKFVEQFYPEFIENLSTCKSPQQMLGSLIKNVFAESQGIDPEKIFSVSIMPCTAKKFEAERPEMSTTGLADVDAVLTTRELARLIKMRGLDLNQLQSEPTDSPFGERSSSGKLFGVTGGVMEAAVRTVHHMITGEDMPEPKISSLRGMSGVKEAHVQVGDLTLGLAVVSGLSNARKLLDEIKAGREDIHFIEVMTCPGGCVSGGGQPYAVDPEAIRKRMKSIYDIDRDSGNRFSHRNHAVQELYKQHLGEPNSEKSHHLLHTHYVKREVLR
jgi:iron-only hydrogenase group A